MIERVLKKQIPLAVVLLLSVFTFGVIHSACAQTVDEEVRSVEGHYQNVADLTANVMQKNYLKSVGKTQTFDGKLWIRKPGKLRLDYSNGQIIVIDNKAVLFYSKKSEQVIKKTFSSIERMNIPVAFLLGAAHIRDDFEVRQPEGGSPHLLELVPKKPGAAMKRMRLVSDDAGRIIMLTIFDKSGNTTEIAFSSVQEGVGVDDAIFVFKAPKGTEIIEQ